MLLLLLEVLEYARVGSKHISSMVT